MNKAKAKAKAKRKNFKVRIKAEKEGSRLRKIEKAERNRRFFNGEHKDGLPEDRFVLNSEPFEREDFLLLAKLHERSFFYKLMEALDKKECEHDHQTAKELLHQMKMKDEDIRKIMEVFKEYGGHCDCEVIYNVVSKLYQDDTMYDKYMY